MKRLFFESQKCKSKEFTSGNSEFCVVLATDHIILEYCGKSFFPKEFLIKMVINPGREEIQEKFVYSFSKFNNVFELINKGVIVSEIDIDIVENTNIQPFLGMINLGNTCYLNSLIVSLYFLPEIKKYIYNSTGYYAFLLKKLFYKFDLINAKISEGRGYNDIEDEFYNNIIDFVTNLPFVPSVKDQQDVHEFSKMLFDKLENEDKNIKNVIEGEMTSIIESSCGCKSVRTDPFQDISVPLKTFEGEYHSLEESLDVFCKEEILSEYKCEKHGEVSAKKRTVFSRLPDVLFVLVNRFIVNWETGEYKKNNSYYEFPEEINLNRYCSSSNKTITTTDYNILKENDIITNNNFDTKNNVLKQKYCTQNNNKPSGNDNVDKYESEKKSVDRNIYDDKSNDIDTINGNNYKLYSVIVHSGSNMDEGHFYTYLNLNKKYYKFNDHTVYETLKEEAINWNYGGNYVYNSRRKKSFSAYYLIYRKSNNTCTDFNTIESYCRNIDKWPFNNMLVEHPVITYQYFTDLAITGYQGPGQYNFKNKDFPITKVDSNSCKYLDNVSVIFKKYTLYDLKFNIISDCSLKHGETYFITQKKKRGILVFFKLFNQEKNCIHKSQFSLLVSAYVNSLEEIEKMFRNNSIELENAKIHLFIERTHFDTELINYSNSVNENNDLIYSENKPFITELNDFSKLRNGDIVIATLYPTSIIPSYNELFNHRFINIEVNNTFFSFFVEKSLDFSQLEKKIQEIFISDKILIDKEKLDFSHSDNLEPSRINQYYNIPCILESGFIIQISILNTYDPNANNHLHPIIIQTNIIVKDLLELLKSTPFYCINLPESQNNLQIISSHKNTINTQIHSENDIINENTGLLIITTKMANPIKVVFCSSDLTPIGYPFYIEKPHTLKDLQTHIFPNMKIFIFDGLNYHEDLHLSNDTNLLSSHIIFIQA